MLEQVVLVLGVVAMGGAFLLTPLGLPGNWIMLAVVGAGVLFGQVGPWLFGGLLLAAAAAEAGEYLLVRRYSRRYGASSTAFWGAVAGGLVGAVVGAPVPVAGSLVAGVVGTFVGAAAVELWSTHEVRAAGRVGWGALLGRVTAAAVKTAAGVAILVAGGAALLVR